MEKTASEPTQKLVLPNGLEIWEMPLSALREQDKNARFMSKEMQERLTLTIRRDKRLESLPLCAKTEFGYEIVSGHHRVRSAFAARLDVIHVLLDVTGLTRDQIRAKQLSHNSIQGDDDEQIKARLYEQIQDADSKLEAFVNNVKGEIKFPKSESTESSAEVPYKTVGIAFLPSEHARWTGIADAIRGMHEELYVTEMEKFELFKKLLNRVSREYDIRAFGTILDKIAEMVEEKLGKEPEEQEIVFIRDLFETACVSKAQGAVVKQAIDKMKEKEELHTKAFGARCLELLAAEYLSGA